jgi:hypothetical protein
VIHNNFQGIIKPRRMRWAGHVACIREESTKFWWKARKKETTRKIKT